MIGELGTYQYLSTLLFGARGSTSAATLGGGRVKLHPGGRSELILQHIRDTCIGRANFDPEASGTF